MFTKFNVLANLERQIKSNGQFLSANQSFKEALENDSMNNLKTKIILVADITKDLTPSQSDDEFNNLLKLYRFNLVRCEVIRKLSVELDYARHALVKSIKTQKKLLTARNRVDWLENEIEQLILSNKNVIFFLFFYPFNPDFRENYEYIVSRSFFPCRNAFRVIRI